MDLLKTDLETVLRLEREGERRLEEAQTEAKRLLEDFRYKADKLRQEAELKMALEREARLTQVDEEISERIARLENHFAGLMEEMTRRAQENRERAIALVLGWLKGQGG